MAKKARVLVGFHLEGNFYQPDQVVEFDDKLAKSLEKDGAIDSAVAAVTDSVERLGVKPVKHAMTDAEAARLAASKD